MTPLQRAILLLAVRADSTIRAVQDQIEQALGKSFLEPPPSNLEAVYNDTTPDMPIIFVLSPGADPMADLLRLATKVNMVERKVAVSLGQGQTCQLSLCSRQVRTQWQ